MATEAPAITSASQAGSRDGSEGLEKQPTSQLSQEFYFKNPNPEFWVFLNGYP